MMSEPRTFLQGAAQLRSFIAALVLAALCGCATQHDIPQNTRPFVFKQDSFAFTNELSWEYFYDANGKWCSKKRSPAPKYSQHCFVVSRSARQFFLHARFDPTQPKATPAEYKKLTHRVVRKSLTTASIESQRVTIPGYTNSWEFSREHEAVIKKEAGGAWHSYFQRGHWRMMLPFGQKNQEKTAAQLVAKIKNNGAPIVHLVCFPQLTINHAAVLYAATETPEKITFSVYDPNYPDKPATLIFDRSAKQFIFPTNTYFEGGRVNVYEIYKSFWL